MNPPNVIGVCGQKGAGKDTLAKWFIDRGYVRSGFADPIKWMLNQAFGWEMSDWEDREWKEHDGPMAAITAFTSGGRGYRDVSPRYLAQWLGTEVVRNNFGNDAWINVWKQRWHDTGQLRTVVADVRFQNEVDAIHKLGGIVIRVTRKGDRSGETFYDNDQDVVASPHESEQTERLYGIDHEIANDGTIQDLHDKIALYAGEKAT